MFLLIILYKYSIIRGLTKTENIRKWYHAMESQIFSKRFESRKTWAKQAERGDMHWVRMRKIL